MDALYFLKFWRPTTTTTTTTHQPTSETTTNCIVVNADDEVDEGEDSFFELELTVPDDDSTKSNRNSISNPLDKDSYNFDYNKQLVHILSNKAGIADRNIQHTTLTLPTNDLLSKRKILPIEPTSKPHSPSSSLLKSAPGFKVLMFKKSKSMASHKPEKTEEVNINASKSNKKQEKKYFTVKFKLEEAVNIPVFTRDNSLRRKISEDSLSDDSSKKFSMEVLHKYLKLIKPLYVKVMRKHQNEKGRCSAELTSVTSPISSPASLNANSPKEKQGNIPSGIRVACKHLGKSKSASAANGVLPPGVSRRDDSLLLQHDGIQSAILHCKNSFHSSRENSLLSRFSSDLLNENSVNSSPRISSEGNGIN